MSKNSIIIQMSSEEAALLRGMQKVLDKERQVENGFKKVSQAADKVTQSTTRAGQAGKRSFGASAQSQIAATATKYAGLATVITTVTNALQAQAHAAKEAAGANRQNLSGAGLIAQRSNTTAQVNRSLAEARKTFLAGGATSLNEAQHIQVAIENAGLEKQRALLASLSATQIVQDVPGLARAISQARSSFGASAGTPRDIINKSLAAAAITPSTAEEVLAGGARAGASASLLGISDREVLAATAVISQTKGDAGIAGTRVDALQRALIRQGGFRGKGLRRSIADIAGRGLSDSETLKMLGSSEAFEAFALLRSNDQLFGKTVAATSDRDVISRKIGFVLGNEETFSTIRENQAIAKRKLGDTPLGTASQLLNAQFERDSVGANVIERGAIGINKLAAWLFGDENILRMSRTLGADLTPEANRFLDRNDDNPRLEALDREAKAAQDLERAAANIRQSTEQSSANALRREAATAQE